MRSSPPETAKPKAGLGGIGHLMTAAGLDKEGVPLVQDHFFPLIDKKDMGLPLEEGDPFMLLLVIDRAGLAPGTDPLDPDPLILVEDVGHLLVMWLGQVRKKID
jgi:hypothetical protein